MKTTPGFALLDPPQLYVSLSAIAILGDELKIKYQIINVEFFFLSENKEKKNKTRFITLTSV